MDERRKQLVEEYARRYGIPFDAAADIYKLIAKGELGATYVQKLMGSELRKQEETRSLFRMTAQELDADATDEYLEVFPNIGKIDESAVRKKFVKLKIKNDRLQQRNIMITPEMWHILVESDKEVLTDNIFKTSVDLSTGQVVFSELLRVKNLEKLDTTISHRKDSEALVLRTIQFDFLNTTEDYESGKIKRFTKKELKKSSRMFEKFLRAATRHNFEEIYSMADSCLNFSIHDYYLPYGFSKDGLEKAVLLMRYDHCFEKHKNSNMPKYYDMFFPISVEEPHFHFNEGFGQIYKLLTSSGQGNIGSGYALGLSDLYAYLGALNNLNSLPNERKKIIENNDFGMPFLNMLKSADGLNATQSRVRSSAKRSDKDDGPRPAIKKAEEERQEVRMTRYRIENDVNEYFGRKDGPLKDITECLTDLYLANALDAQYLEFEMAYKFMDMVGGIQPRSLEEFRTIDSPSLSNFEELLYKMKHKNNSKDNTDNTRNI